MAKYGVKMVDNYTDETIEVYEEVFDSEYDAEEYACEMGGAYREGCEVLKLSDPFGYEDYDTDEDAVRFDVYEID